MEATADKARKRATARQRAPQTPDEELEALKVYATKITSSKARSKAFLVRAGLMDAKGGWTKPYRD